MITIQEILGLRSNIFIKSKVKFIRHREFKGISGLKDLNNNRENLLEFQKEQETDVFNCDYIVSFIALENSKSLLIGIFKVGEFEKIGDGLYYNLEEQKGFEDINERVVIDWGTSIKWHQWYYNKKEVIEIIPKGSVGPYPGHSNVVLEFNELKRIIDNKDSNREWIVQLSSINGIYLILDNLTGNQYVGSANSSTGILGRWENYVKTKHGGNIMLMELMRNDLKYHLNFTYSILETLPSNTKRPKIVNIENLYKRKLGSRAFGLNQSEAKRG